MKMKKKTNQSDNFVKGFQIAVGILVFFVVFFLLIDVELKVGFIPEENNFKIEEKIITPTEKEKPFCPDLNKLDITKNDDMDSLYSSTSFNINEKYSEGEYILDKHLSICRKGQLRGENTNYFYCPLMYSKLGSDGTILSRGMINMVYDPKKQRRMIDCQTRYFNLVIN